MNLFRKNRKGNRILILISLMLLVAFIAGFCLVNVHAMARRIIVYFPQWGMYNAVHQTFNVGMIPWTKVTVVNHAFMEVDANNQLASIDPYADFQAPFAHSTPGGLSGHFGEYAYYKTQYPNVKIMISVGGWTRGQYFHQMASTASSRATFIQSLISYFQQYPWIDGFDLDWEYPGIDRAPDPRDQYDRGCPGGPEDKQNFTALLREIRAAYNANGYANKLLTIAAPGGVDKVVLQEPAIYEQYLDFLNVMTYDFHGAWELVTNHHSPIYKNPNDPSPTSPVDIKNCYNTDYIMKYYENTIGIHPSKLAVGAPYYSRGWQGVDPNTGTNGMFANATGAVVGNWDNPSAPGGQNSHIQMLVLENTSGYTKYRDSYTLTPWLYNRSLGITYTYEDATSLSSRCDYIINNNYGGIIIWEISGDQAPSFPLTSLVYNKLSAGGVTPPPTPTLSPGVTPIPTPTVPTPTPTPTPYAAPWAPNVSYALGNLVTYGGNAYKCIYAHTSLVGWEPPNAPTLWAIYNGPVVTGSPSAGITPTPTITVTPTATNTNTPTTGVTPTATNTNTPTTGVTPTATNTPTTSSVTPTATVTPTPSGGASAWQPNTYYAVNALVTYGGHTYKCIQAHTSLVGWEPPNVPALWQLQS